MGSACLFSLHHIHRIPSFLSILCAASVSLAPSRDPYSSVTFCSAFPGRNASVSLARHQARKVPHGTSSHHIDMLQSHDACERRKMVCKEIHHTAYKRLNKFIKPSVIEKTKPANLFKNTVKNSLKLLLFIMQVTNWICVFIQKKRYVRTTFLTTKTTFPVQECK